MNLRPLGPEPSALNQAELHPGWCSTAANGLHPTAAKVEMEPRGIEPRFAECDSAVIPLDHGPGNVSSREILMPLHVTFKQPEISICTKRRSRTITFARRQNIERRQPVSPARVLHLAIFNVCQPANECGKKKLRQRDQGACSGVCCCLQRCWAKS